MGVRDRAREIAKEKREGKGNITEIVADLCDEFPNAPLHDIVRIAKEEIADAFGDK